MNIKKINTGLFNYIIIMMKYFNIMNMLYLFITVYTVYFTGDRFLTDISAQSYTLTTEYDLNQTLDQGYQIDQLRIERNEDYALFVLNGTDTIAHNGTGARDHFETAKQYYHGIVDFVSTTTGLGRNRDMTTENVNTDPMFNIITGFSDNRLFYRIDFERGAARDFSNRYVNYNDSNVNVVFFDRPETLMEFLSLRSIVPFIMFILILRMISVVLTSANSKTGLDRLFTQGMDMVNATKNVETKFADVAGMIEPKQHIMKYVDILKNREKYDKMGARIPKGVLLCGPPGCGKTLLAKAVAGEAGVTFIATSGSDFDEMFVGVGAARVKNLFNVARACAPCIIFIDEIDSVGQSRGKGYRSSHSSDTINKILMEMDGFKSTENIMVMASTNRASDLDKALLRSGRFDSKIYIDPPNRGEREEIFGIYLKHIKLPEAMDINALSKKLSHMTPSMTGADIANVCNQAAITAASNNSDIVTETNLVRSIDDVGFGIEKNSRKVNSDLIRVVAYHEAGHALLGYILKHGKSPVKLSVIPRGHGNLGYTQPHDSEDPQLTRQQLVAEIYSLLGGRAAEIIKFKTITTGAESDFARATDIIKSMVTRRGMYIPFAPTVYTLSRDNSDFLSESKRTEIENLIQSELSRMFNQVMDILEDRIDDLETLATKLIEEEQLEYDQIKLLLPDKESIVTIPEKLC